MLRSVAILPARSVEIRILMLRQGGLARILPARFAAARWERGLAMTGVSWKRSETGAWVVLLAGAAIALLMVATVLSRTADADAGGDTGSNSTRCHKLPREVPHLVPHAAVQDGDCLRDLTTAGTQETGHTDKTDWSGLNAAGTHNPTGVPGLQVDGYFPDDSRTNTNNG